MRLVYVDRRGGTEPEPATAGSALISRLGVHTAFEQLVQELDAPANVRVDCITLYGSPAQELLAFAAESESDLIAVGSLRHERVERWVLGKRHDGCHTRRTLLGPRDSTTPMTTAPLDMIAG